MECSISFLFPASVYDLPYTTPSHPIHVKVPMQTKQINFKVYSDAGKYEAKITVNSKTNQEFTIVVNENPSSTRSFTVAVFEGLNLLALSNTFRIANAIEVSYNASVLNIEHGSELQSIHGRIDSLSTQVSQLATLLNSVFNGMVAAAAPGAKC